MHHVRPGRAPLALVLLGVVAIFQAGCLEGFKTTRVRYDKDKDQFAILSVYQDIRPGNGDKQAMEKDFRHLQNLYLNRDHIIAGNFLPEMTEPAIIRLGPNTLAPIDLCDAKPTQAQQVKAPLNTIHILPGRFFERGERLGYYHQIAVPGAVVDFLLLDGGGYLKPGGWLEGMVAAEMAQRQQNKPPGTWENNQKAMSAFAVVVMLGDMDKRAGLDRQRPPGAGAKPQMPSSLPLPFSDETLQGWAKAIKAGTLTATRTGSNVSIKLAMTADEAAQLGKTIASARKDALDALNVWAKDLTDEQKSGGAGFWLDSARRTFESIEAKPDREGAVLCLDLVAMANLFGGNPAGALPKLEDDQKARAEWLAARVAKDLKSDPQQKVDQIVADFAKGALGGVPAEEPVTPGEGLDIKPATQPAE